MTSQTTAASSLVDDPTVTGAIETIVQSLVDRQRSITGARPGSPELSATLDGFLSRQEAIKGRPAVLPYVGSGLGRGPLVELADGSVKWDLINGIGVHMFGHSDPDLVATALGAALSDTLMQGNLQFNADAIEFAELLLAEAGRSSALKHAFLINTGAMANESALKLCFQKNAPASRVLAFGCGFAGRTTTMAQIGDSPANREGLPLTVPVDYVPFFDPDRADGSIDESVSRLRQYVRRYPRQHAGFVMELVQGEGGFNVAPREFFVPLVEMCREQGIAVWIDEIQTFGRTAEMFYFQQLGLGEYVDVVTIGKLSQVCACLYTESYQPKPGLLSATFIGSTVALQVGRRMIERLRDGGYYGPGGRIAKLHEAFSEHAGRLIERHPEFFGPVSGPSGEPVTAARFHGGVGGLMRLTPFGGEKSRILRAVHALFDEGVIAFYCGQGPHHIRFLPPVGVMEPAHFDEVFEIVERAFGRVISDQ